MNLTQVEKDENKRQELIKQQKCDGYYNPITGVYKYGEDVVYDLTKTNGECGLFYRPMRGNIFRYNRV